MRRHGILMSTFFMSTFFLSLGGCVQIGGGSGGSGGSSGSSGPGGDNGALCSADKPCPSGQFCYNGVCAVGCNSDGDCAKNQYCDTGFDRLCHNKTVTTCPDTACPSGQSCVSGECVPPPPNTMCSPTFDANDGCESNAICLPQGEKDAKCYEFPYCPQDGKCPVGSHGAVCNDDSVSGKARICLAGACTSASNCPSNWHCVRFHENDVAGSCSNGAELEPCAANTDCNNGLTCQVVFAGGPGFCSSMMMGTGLPSGAPCDSDSQCQSGNCVDQGMGFKSCQ